MAHSKAVIFSLAAVFVSAAVLPAQESISIGDVKNGFASRYKNETASVRGAVVRGRRVESQAFSGYYLRDRFNAVILIRTTDALPDLDSELQVTGIVLQDADTKEIYISEKSRQVVGKTAEEAARHAKEEEAARRQGEIDQQRTLLIGIGIIVVALIALAAFLTWRKRAAVYRVHESTTVSVADTAPASTSMDDFKTVRVYKTTKVLPGNLVVMEEGKETDIIYLSDQSGRGEIEIGRDSPDVAGGIRIKDRSNTVSRRQAKLVYSEDKREFQVVNLASDQSNPTAVNGKALATEEAVVLADGDEIGMGNLNVKFRKR